MDRPDPHPFRAAVAALVIGLATCGAAAEPVAPETADPFVLVGQGKMLARAGHHEEAVTALQRAVAVMRSEYGLFDDRQQEALKVLAASLTALDRLPEAQELMVYRVRTAEKTYGAGSPKVVPVVCELGDWFSEVGKSREARMTFYMALNIVGDKLSLQDPIIVEPLRGIARTRMRAQSYAESRLPAHEAPYDPTKPRYHEAGVLQIGARDVNQEGEEALKRAVRILDADPNAAPPQQRIETLLQMGDWYEIKRLPREALSYYRRAWQLINATPGLPGSVSTALNLPQRVYYPTPPIVAYVPVVHPEETRSHYVETEFTVNADGSVRDARIVEHNTRDRYADDILQAVRASRFRPKFVEGQPVAATGITYREVFWTGKPRE
ncbi:MAG TPA: energy transducer TonB [Steroidobacteraceae bacterium]|nr:energy transducer TonB [Steroidobacteraceae bacterium]